MSRIVAYACVVILTMSTPVLHGQEAISLFDGKTLDGWETISSDQAWWRVQDGLITGGSLSQRVPRNTFLATERSYQNFELKLSIRIQGAGGFINSGIQIRSIRAPKGSEMIGYQVDAGDGWWGKMYDESRRKKVIAEAEDLTAVNAAIEKDGWNEYRIVANGPQIQSWINGVKAIDYVEDDPNIPLDGKIGFQVHGGGQALVQVKDILLTELPPTPNAPTWEKLSQHTPGEQPLSPAEELAGFRVPDGFEVELVAEESVGIGKFVALAFDAKGRLWTTTALEYPVDANESPDESRELFARGGRDKVLVIDNPYAEKVAPPRVFADGLVMPLGVLPHGDGAIVQYGNDIRVYHDKNQDGKAESFDVLLTGFGTQDSHLFPHQFTRVPGNWILTAQGLFNSSRVHRPDNQPFAGGATKIPFHHCKLARFTPSGDRFESVTHGPNNIWGLTVSREGATWIQEANDLGYPIAPFEPGVFLRTVSKDLLKPYQPLMPPPMGPPQMGGTGLSGLTLADDRNSWPSPWGYDSDDPNAPRRFYLANPITSRIQMIEATPDGQRYTYKKLPDFLVSQDPRFRPVAIQFGPDGSLYVVDWYNKIISHNEVPRTHAERDKTRGRIWRIRHKDQPRTQPVDLTVLTDEQLAARLGDANARIADLSWQQIVDRQATSLIPTLTAIVGDEGEADDRRLGALWALEGLQTVPTDLLRQISNAKNANLRHEAVRIAAAQERPAVEFVTIAGPLVDDPSPHVRSALGDALRRLPRVTPDVVAIMLQLGKAPASGDVWTVYDRQFERFLARWAMEVNREAVAQFLDSPQGKLFPVENRALATLAIGNLDGALALAHLLPELGRGLHDEEIRVLLPHFQHQAVAQQLTRALRNDSTRVAMLGSLLNLRTQIDWQPLKEDIEAATAQLLTQPSQVALALELVESFQLEALSQDVMAIATSPQSTAQHRLAALQALAELPSPEIEPLEAMAFDDSLPQEIRHAAIRCIARSTDPQATELILELLSDSGYQVRQLIISDMSNRRDGAATLLEAYDSGELQLADFPADVITRLTTLLPMHETIRTIEAELARQGQTVLALAGGPDDYVATPITLEGPFTVETWVKLAPSIDNTDGILGQQGVLDINFFEETPRVWLPRHDDIVIADRKLLPEVWTHMAVTRDAEGFFRIFLNGELSATSQRTDTTPLKGVMVGLTTKTHQGTAGQFAEYRVWNKARTADEIRMTFDRAFAESGNPPELVHHFHGNHWGELSGSAASVATLDAPKLLSGEEAAQQEELFDRYRQLARRPGILDNGKQLFTKHCLSCHQFGGQGGNIGPALDGIGLRGTEAILRNVLTPSAAIEGGYRSYQVVTTSGQIYSGLLVSEDEDAIVIRKLNSPDRRIAKSDIQRSGFTSISVMPEGLLNSLTDEEVSDLFSYLSSLKQGVSQ
ncbi:family 16 glycoside hydrolase [Bremerella sp. JC770]|uniref:DUF7133 domain-containing protein n=1 Tax=Bremerella sp. JC770 TaxID=3232137 RepID=UPI003459877F